MGEVLFYAPKIAGDSRVPFVAAGVNSMSPIRIRTIRQIGPDIAIEALPFGVR